VAFGKETKERLSGASFVEVNHLKQTPLLLALFRYEELDITAFGKRPFRAVSVGRHFCYHCSLMACVGSAWQPLVFFDPHLAL